MLRIGRMIQKPHLPRGLLLADTDWRGHVTAAEAECGRLSTRDATATRYRIIPSVLSYPPPDASRCGEWE